ncbi:hypothetical protein [Candidatus Pantoea communis]|uniref:hypothetical protein n=1 Tax=Candidatus Pantoea communis TaxID=2608354 RepID=UPI001420260E|nr:hypothetical protein [Pantoea communis]
MFVLLNAFVFSSQSADVKITAVFEPDITKPENNSFTNTTIKGGYCTRFPGNCRGDIFAVAVPGLSAQKHFDNLSDNIVNNHQNFDVDGSTRIVKLINTKTGFETEASFRLSVFSVRTAGVPGNVQTGYSPSGGCTGIAGSGNGSQFSFAWSLPDSKINCYQRLKNGSDFSGVGTIFELSFAYILTTPKPLSLPAGKYVGVVVYTVGDEMDIDFHALSYNDNEVRITIEATVEHAFFYQFPSGSENVQLSPPNGWSSWINGGMIPQKLSKEVLFTLSSSSGFKIWMQCEHNAGAGCGLKNQATAETVPLDVKMTIPGFTSNRQPVRNMLLNTDAAGHTIDLPGQFVVDLRSKLDFVVNRPEVEKMVKAPGSNWKGAVTLIFDSEVE